MSTINHPAIKANQFAMVPVPNVRTMRSPYSQMLSGVDLIGSAWRFTIGYPSQERNEGTLQAFFNRLHSAVNNVPLWDMNRPRPLGTMRGTPTVEATVLQGASTIFVLASPGDTLIPGDKIGVAQMLFEVADPVQFDSVGVAQVNVTTRVRKQVSAGVPVIWDAPTTLAVLNGDGIMPVLYGVDGSDTVQAEFMEAW